MHTLLLLGIGRKDTESGLLDDLRSCLKQPKLYVQ